MGGLYWNTPHAMTLKVGHYLQPSGITALLFSVFLFANEGGLHLDLPVMKPIFITGIGTGIGKTLVSAILVEAYQADYWKPVQAGFSAGTDLEWIRDII